MDTGTQACTQYEHANTAKNNADIPVPLLGPSAAVSRT